MSQLSQTTIEECAAAINRLSPADRNELTECLIEDRAAGILLPIMAAQFNRSEKAAWAAQEMEIYGETSPGVKDVDYKSMLEHERGIAKRRIAELEERIKILQAVPVNK